MSQKINYDEVIKIPEEGFSLPGKSPEKIRPDMRDRIDRILIPEQCIKKRVAALGKRISKDYKGVKKLYFITVLKGAFIFGSDLGREIDRHEGPELICDFYEAKTYGLDIKTAEEREREVRIIRRPKYIEGIDVLLVDDLNDTAVTLLALRKDLIENVGFEPSRLKICVLLDKSLKNPSERIKELKRQLIVDYIGFEGPDRWVAGYGIDAGEEFRLFRSIIAVNESFYLNRKKLWV
jgi:hypoxanthine phosphoribosyltransferase